MRRAPAAWTVLACALLLGCARAAARAEPPKGICRSIDARGNPQELLTRLPGCRVIEGHLSVVLMEHSTPKSYENMSFPELREVTGYIKIYRFGGIRSLGDLFPNLAVIRGMQLFKDYAFIVFDSEHLEVLGLRSLTTIENGAVRIQNNDRLCYVETIDWDHIVQNDYAANNVIKSNYDTRLCGLCPNAQSGARTQCPVDADTSKLLCWDDRHCQKVCPTSCGSNACMPDGRCCHAECLGGCDGPRPDQCHVCRHFSFGYGNNRTCTKTCPAGLYELYRRCVTEEDCYAQPPPLEPLAAQRSAAPAPAPAAAPLNYKILHNKCIYNCPAGYMERKSATYRAICVPCPPPGCRKDCPGGKVDSIGSADTFRGCTHIIGTLEISIRAIGNNTMSTLESALGEVRSLGGGLKVTRSNTLVSLMFLRSLERIAAPVDANNKGDALHILNNPNLELLWDWEKHREISIDGRLNIHSNPKLCYSTLVPLETILGRKFIDKEITNNGDRASCDLKELDLKVSDRRRNVIVLTWNKFCMDDARDLLGYSIYYIATDQNVTIYGDRDACSDTWSVLDITLDEAKTIAANESAASDDASGKSCRETNQPLFHPITQLIPFTRYAAYVKTYTTLQNSKGAQSKIIYFTTLPGQPSPPQGLTVNPLGPHSVFIKWAAPAKPNSTVISYYVEIQANSYNEKTIIAGNIDYCGNPNALSSLLTVRGERERSEEAEREQERSRGAGAVSESCACAAGADPRPATRFSERAERERIESKEFEDSLQNSVYLKSSGRGNKNRTSSAKNRSRRSIDASLSMLVILAKNKGPMLANQTYKNDTDDKNYMTSLYYELGASTRNLTVTSLRHYTWYTVNVWACRKKHPAEDEETDRELWCSVRSYYTFRTLELANADVVTNVHAEVVPSNKTEPSDVRITWQPPNNPNGFVAAYNVHTRMEDNTAQYMGMQTCISASECKNNMCEFIARKVLPGNYSIRVTPVTVSGAGNVSAVAYVDVTRSDSSYDWIWGLIGGCVIVVVVAGGGIWYARRSFLPQAEANKLFASVNPEYVSTVYVPDEWEVPRTSIEFLRELGQGSFGMVYEGIGKGIEKGKPETRCAVKTVNEHATDRERIDFLNEASVMKAFDTFHVVRLLGVVSRGQPTLVVMELMEYGDLKTYLRSHRPDAENSLPKKDRGDPPTLQNILQMAIEIADGMAYLSAKKFVHRDLAARNCMVAGDLTVKVGDFGMTRDIYETDYYRKGSKGLLPVRWMSPESLKDGVFSSSTDVWSYGVVLWEMATLAMQPYQGLSNEQVVRYVVEGGVMERPEHCPDRLYELMRACWAHRPHARPSFLQLVADLAPTAQPFFRHRSFFHSPLGQELYALQKSNIAEDEQELPEVNVGAVATGSGSNLFGVSGRLASWVRELSSLRSRGDDDAAAEPLQPARAPRPLPLPLSLKAPPNGLGAPAPAAPASTGC